MSIAEQPAVRQCSSAACVRSRPYPRPCSGIDREHAHVAMVAAELYVHAANERAVTGSRQQERAFRHQATYAIRTDSIARLEELLDFECAVDQRRRFCNVGF